MGNDFRLSASTVTWPHSSVGQLLGVALHPPKELIKLADMLYLGVVISPLHRDDENHHVNSCMSAVGDGPEERDEQLQQLRDALFLLRAARDLGVLNRAKRGEEI